MAKPRKPRAKRQPDAQPSPPAPVEHHPQTHAFAYPPSGSLMVCACGAEQDLRLVDGKAVRFYRMSPGAEWSQAVAMCSRYADVEAGPFDHRPNVGIGEDHYAAGVGTVPPPTSANTTAEEESAEQSEETSRERLARLRKLNPGMFEPEVIDGVAVDEAAEDVDLVIACSPVLRAARANVFPQRDEQMDAMVPIEAVPLDNGMYRVYLGEGPRDLPAGVVKVMRARFLLQRQALTKMLYQMPEPARSRWANLYKIHWLPPEGSPLHAQMMTGGVITIPRNGDAPVDFLAVMRMLSTPGAEIPAVCPIITEKAEP